MYIVYNMLQTNIYSNMVLLILSIAVSLTGVKPLRQCFSLEAYLRSNRQVAPGLPLPAFS